MAAGGLTATGGESAKAPCRLNPVCAVPEKPTPRMARRWPPALPRRVETDHFLGRRRPALEHVLGEAHFHAVLPAAEHGRPLLHGDEPEPVERLADRHRL